MKTPMMLKKIIRIWYKVQQIVKAKPETVKNLLDKSIKDLYASKENSKLRTMEKLKILKP
jgi:hypothetical protein